MRDNADLKNRIYSRANKMIKSGLIKEINYLVTKGLEQNASAANAICYREGLSHISNNLDDPKALLEAITIRNWKLVKKQKTWFRRQIPVDQVVNLSTKNIAEVLSYLFYFRGTV